MHLTLLIPELIWPEPDDQDTFSRLACPALAALLSRTRAAATRHRLAAPDTFDAAIADHFGLAADAPIAALRLLGDGIAPGDESWACADPVHLRFHQERLVLADGAAVGIDANEADALVGELNRYFADLGEFRRTAPDRWYLRLTSDVAFSAQPLSAMAGRRVDRQLPEDTGTAWLRKLLNEAQMVLHGHLANEARADSGRMTINSLWLWGPGRLAASAANAPRHFDRVLAAHPLARGLALHEGAQLGNAPAGFAELAAGTPPDEKVLVVLDDRLDAVQYEDGDAWARRLNALDAAWFAPLQAAIRRGGTTLTLCASTIYGRLEWQIGRGDAWRLWRRSEPLAALAQRLARDAGAVAP